MRGLRNCVCHNLRSYPLVQQMRRMREAGDMGEILFVQGSYAQDWLLYDTDWNWRIDSKVGGVSRCMADIGSHWFDMAEYVTGLQVSSLCADLQTFHTTRKEPKQAIETFANKLLGPEDYVARPVDTEDFGAVIFQMGTRARGSLVASQVSAGRKNRLSYGHPSLATRLTGRRWLRKHLDDQVRPPHLPMVEAVRDGKLVIPIGSKLPLSQAVEAQTVAEKGGIGKVLPLA
jgi:predicted dehydrogenase